MKTKIVRNIKCAVWFWIHNHRRNKIVARFARLCKNIHRASEHPTYDVNVNGEKAILMRTVSSDALLFDVGANVGKWSDMALSLFPEATVYAFELNPHTASLLGQSFSNRPNVFVNSFGLGAKSQTVEFYSYEGKESVLSTLHKPIFNQLNYSKQTSLVKTGDEVCRELGIERIDFLKIDAEGTDLKVLEGFTDMLDKQKISVIQFEHEGGGFLSDFYHFLKPKNYSIGKLYANYVDFKDHDIEMEHFLGPNYIAIPKQNNTLISSLKAGW